VKGAPTSFWAKLDKDEHGVVRSWHPLVDHCADVAAVFQALLNVDTIRHRLAGLAGRGDLDPVTCARLGVFAALHDLGKANLGFQAKGRPELGPTAGHVGEAIAMILDGPDALRSTLHPETLLSWGEAAGLLLAASICHHGRPVAASHPPFQNSWWSPRAGLDPAAMLAELASASLQWFPLALEDGPPLPDSAAFQHGFAGLVMLADWLGSDRSPALFPFSELHDDDRIEHARVRARRALAWIGLDPGGSRSVVQGRDPFAAIAPSYTPRAAQRELLALPLPETGSVTILEAETGSGKTEAAVARFLALFAAKRVDGMMFALPTRTAATQIFSRVVAATASAFPDPTDRPPVVLAVPGYLRVDDREGRRLPGFEVLWPDAPGARERHRGWAAEQPKRFLAGTIVVGTIDQVLLSALMVSHSHLRAAALARHLLVVDEVHASDTYMTRILVDVLRRHTGAGGHALLLSATLASEARTRLLGDPDPPTRDAAATAPYPLVSTRDGEQRLTRAVAHDGRDKIVDVAAIPWLEDPAAIATHAIAAAEQGAKVIVLRNTVAACLATQEALEQHAPGSAILFACTGIVAPHHARYARADRAALDTELEARFGKTRPEGGCIVAATQTVQQSLDLDADLLLTDLCPIDVLLQRIGRLHRHVRRRPAGFEIARAVVLVPADRNLTAHIRDDGRAAWSYGIGTVYEDLRVLEATWRLGERTSRWSIPSMNRRLVEDGLHREALASIALGDRWRAHAGRLAGQVYGDTRLAELNVVDWSAPYAEQNFPSDRRIPSRLGESDRRVVFSEVVTSPFGHEIHELTIKAAWARDVPADVSEATGVRVGEGGFHFDYGPKGFVYDRLGIRPDDAEAPKRALWVEDDDEA
jgi:CRISPR-associated endonuclease/helicase Cas3